MTTIRFSNIQPDVINDFTIVFQYISQGKEQEYLDDEKHIDAEELAYLLGERFETKFWWPTQDEAATYWEKWESISDQSRLKNPDWLNRPWDFESWVDALNNAEIEFQSLCVDGAGTGELIFKQLAWPSGGIEAVQYLVKIFDGTVIACDAV